MLHMSVRPLRRVALTAAFVMLVGGAAAQATYVPAPGSPYSTGSESFSVNPGLFSPDALTDLAVVNGTSSNVDVFDQVAGDGGFTLTPSSPLQSPLVGGGPNFAAVADFNGDGRQDLAVSNFDDGTVSVDLQQASGAFTLEETINLGGSRSGAVATGDFNGDGKPDLAVADWDTGKVSIFLRNNANTGFTAGATVSTGGVHPRYIAVGDLDGANGPDLAVTNADSQTVAVLLNQPGGNFTPATGSPYATGTTPQYVAIAPLDADAHPDLAVANFGDNTVTVLDHQPDGSFAAEAGSPFAVGTNPVGIAAADLRQTGRDDLVVADAGSSAFSELDNTGTTFTRGPDTPTGAGTSPYGIAIGQFNSSDSIPDVAVTSQGVTPNQLSVFINHPAPRATTLAATDVTGTTATLNATVNPAGSDTDAHFEYGTTTAYGSLAPAGGELAAGADATDHAISRLVQGLTPSTTYHFRAVATNAGGQVVGADQTFTTAASSGPPTSALGGPPQAYLSAPSDVVVGTPTTLSAEGSTPASGLTYKLDLDGSGQFATDLGTARSLQTTFTTPGDVKVSLRVTDASGRTDTVRRTVHVTAPPVYAVSYTPTNPKAGQTVTFKVDQVASTAKLGTSKLVPLSGALSTMSYGDGSSPSATTAGLLVPGRDASSSGTFTHIFDKNGTFQVHLNVSDLNGYQPGVTLPVSVGSRAVYSPAITTASASVPQGSCVYFNNGTANQLALSDVGQAKSVSLTPTLPLVVPSTKVTVFGGLSFLNQQPSVATLSAATAIAGSPLAQLRFTAPANLNLSVGGRATTHQAEATVTTLGADTCQQEASIESAVDNAALRVPPYPAGENAGWPNIPECPGGLKLNTYSTARQAVNNGIQEQTTRYTWYSINKWDFGDGTTSGPDAYLPSYTAFHPYDKPGSYTVKLSTTFPTDLANQRSTWSSSCTSNPLNASKPDSRFSTKTTQMTLRVLARYDRLKMRGLWMTDGSGLGGFADTDIPGVYSVSGPLYINTRRVGYGYSDTETNPFDTSGRTPTYDASSDVSLANGVLVVTPIDGSLQIVPDQGEIIGAANLAWQANGQQVGLGTMPTTVRDPKTGTVTPGIVIPAAGPGGTHDLGPFLDPPASLGSGPPPARGAAFHINSADPVLREGNGGTLTLNIHLPQPLGANGGESDETVTQDVTGTGRAARAADHARGLLDNVDVDIPDIELVPGVLEIDDAHLSHHQSQTPPWQATAKLKVFDQDVDMSPDSATNACPVAGGLGFEENGALANAGAVLTGLKIPIPNPPAPNPITALADPAFEIMPATSDRPLDLLGCLTLEDYPDADAFQVTGCVSFLAAGGGVSIPTSETLPFCPSEKGVTSFALTDHNSMPDSAHPGNRILSGDVIRASGTVFLGPTHFNVAQAYIEFRDSPFAVETKGHVGLDLLDGNLMIGADIFGYFRSKSDWAIGGSGGVTQDLICLPVAGCPSVEDSALVSSQGLGACVEIFDVGIGGDVRFSDGTLHPHFPGCDLTDLETDLGVSTRLVNVNASPLRQLAVNHEVESGTVDLPGDEPYALIVVHGTDHSPLVQVRDPDGKVILDDTGAEVQGLPKPTPAPKAINLLKQDPAQPTLQNLSPQGILHNDGPSVYHDSTIDLRHTTMILIRAPKKGRYTITAKPGSSPITSISHSNALPMPTIKATVSGAGDARTLSLQSAVPAGSTVTVAEQGTDLSHTLTTLTTAKASSADPTATIARASRKLHFTPALGPGGRRKLIAVVSRDGIPQQQVVVGSYVAPPPPKTGAIHGLHAKLKGGKLTITWHAAKNARQYVVAIKLRKGLHETRSLGAKAHRLVIGEALARLGATITVQAIGPLSVPGKAATVHLTAVKVKRIKHFVL